MEMEKEILSMLVENHPGVLARVASLFGRRGYNIDSLTVSETNDPGVSRITITVRGNPQILDQILLQTEKLEDTGAIAILPEKDTIQRELLLVKLAAEEKERSAVKEIAEVYKAGIVDLSVDSIVVELTGKPSKIDAFLRVLSPYRIIELCRTGVTAISHGKVTLAELAKENEDDINSTQL